ncbi:MAG: hypothetical protein ABIO70_34455 [Pseudomonadota bacterium]
MTDAELREELSRSPTLALDTTVVHGKGLLGLADKINRMNHKHDTETHLVIGALVYTERQAQERRERGADFDERIVRDLLTSKLVKVAWFTRKDAERASAWLARIAPDDDAWQVLKWQRLAAELGLPRDKRHRVSATVDWFIAAHADSRGWLLVTADRGPEFTCLPRRVGKAQLHRVLDAVLAAD